MDNPNKEGPRGFAVLIQQIDDGALHAELSETVQRVSGDLIAFAQDTATKAKGKIVLTLNFEAKANKTVSVEADIKTTVPKERRAGSTFFLTDGNNLSPNNPRQERLPLREVPTAPVRDVADADRPAKSI